MNKKLLTGLSIFALFANVAFSATYTLESPSKKLKVVLDDAGESLTYKILSGKDVLVNASEVSILKDKKIKVLGEKRASVNKTWKPVWGQFSEVRDNHNELNLSIDAEGKALNLILRLFDNGAGFRYTIDNYEKGDDVEFLLEYNLDDADKYSYIIGVREFRLSSTLPDIVSDFKATSAKAAVALKNFLKQAEIEKEQAKAKGKAKTETERKAAVKKNKKDALKKAGIENALRFTMHFPVMIEKKNGKFLSLLESDLIESIGFDMFNIRYDEDKKLIAGFNALTEKEDGKLVSPWRVILVEDNSGDLLVNNVADNLATECKIADTSWIKTGKGLWDWRILGAVYDGFTYNIDTATYKRLVDFASANGIEFFLMDDGWFSKAEKGEMIINKDLDYYAVLDHSKEKGVGLVLYYDRHKGDFGDGKLFEHYQEMGGVGMKYGFMGTNVEFSRNAIIEGAKSKLMMNFHDSPVPMVGASRTYPNAVTREFCHAQQDARKVFTPSTFLVQAQLHAIQGPLDMNNGNFAINDINAQKRMKGPSKADSYKTTVANECARCMIINTGFVCLPDTPEAYAAKADLFEYIKALPSGKWDESKILHSKLGEYITTARRHGDAWFVSSSANEEGATLPIKLDFLKEGKTYDATLYEDAPETDCFTNPEAYQIRKIKVKKGDIIEAKLAKGGGHNMWIR